MESLKNQVGDTHYTRWKIQPIEFWMRNGWDGCAGSALKYICRHDVKDGAQALDKARHFGQLRIDLLPMSNVAVNWYGHHRITMCQFIEVNGIIREAPTLKALDLWVQGVDWHGERFFHELHALRQSVYGS